MIDPGEAGEALLAAREIAQQAGEILTDGWGRT